MSRLWFFAWIFAFVLLGITQGWAQSVAPRDGMDLRPNAGQEIGRIYEAWLSPLQQGGEEADTPSVVPRVFRSTAPSVARNARESRGHGTLAITRDQGRAYAHVKIEGIDPQDIVLFHIHCGRPGQLGPILVDFGLTQNGPRNLPASFVNGEFSVEITNEDLVAVTDHSHGPLGFFTAGCPIIPGVPMDR
ncbi:MAG: CHRD domain-containing protein, partial [Rhodospirillales bacterium]|nr:CHRD domain-containing protein [Rhodospirillales bacterium]